MNRSIFGAAIRAAGGAALCLAATPALHAQPQPTLAEELATAATQVRATLPQRIDEITTATGVEARGTELVYQMSLSVEVPQAQQATVRRALQDLNQTRLCNNASISALMQRGGSMRHIYTDRAGYRFETRVVACPAGSSG